MCIIWRECSHVKGVKCLSPMGMAKLLPQRDGDAPFWTKCGCCQYFHKPSTKAFCPPFMCNGLKTVPLPTFLRWWSYTTCIPLYQPPCSAGWITPLVCLTVCEEDAELPGCCGFSIRGPRPLHPTSLCLCVHHVFIPLHFTYVNP